MPAGRRTHLVVDLDWAGGLLLAVEDLVIVDADGDEHLVHGCLDTLSESASIDAPGQLGESDGVAVAGVFPVDVAEIVARGHRLERTVGRLFRWVEGDAWELRETLFRGLVGDPEYGEVDDPTSFTIEPQSYTETAPCIPSDAQVSSRTWDVDGGVLSDEEIGVPYPTILGYPGRAPWTESGIVSSSKAAWGSRYMHGQVLVIAGHPVDATHVWFVTEESTTGAERVRISNRSDLLGRAVAVIDFRELDWEDSDAVALTQIADGTTAADVSQVYISWDTSGGGGMVGLDGEVLRGAGDVLTWALSQCDAPVDLGKCKAAAPLLNHIKIDGSIEVADGTMWDWVQRMLLPLLPCSIYDGVDGRYPVVWRYEATRRDAVATLDLDVETDGEHSLIRVDSSNIKNEFVVNYGLSARVGAYQRTARLGRFIEEYATASLDGLPGATVLVTMANPGAAGEGWTITLTTAGAFSVAEDPIARTIDIEIVDGVTIANDVVGGLNSLNAVKQALGHGARSGLPWGLDQEQVRTTALRLSSGAHGSLACTNSQARHGVIQSELTTDYLYDDASAMSVCRWQAALFTQGVERLDVSLPEDRWGYLRQGQPIVFRKAALHKDCVALVENREAADDGVVTYTLLLLADPSRDLVST